MQDFAAFTIFWSCFIAWIKAVGFVVAIISPEEPPPTGWTVKGQVVNCVDGDTIDVSVTTIVRVRLIDCWCPESKIDKRLPEDQRRAEKQAGIAAKKHLESLALGKEVVLHVPVKSAELKDVLTMNRVLGTVWLDGSDKSLNEIQVESGHATRDKGEGLRK